ncbi:hypothetical protein BKA63DRAFT_177442 [Paraphoma chrysanthemicola]|nr:hypothetical protein BKA63DRAFT_177442 [Paraphoma chrysanthemicola]
MSDKRDTSPEEEREKSQVRQAAKVPREPAFEVGDGVQMRVTETGADAKIRTFFKKFTIAARRTVSGHWQYQLTDLNTNALYKAGQWYPENSLTRST